MKYLIPGSDGEDKGYSMEVIYKNSDQDYDSRYMVGGERWRMEYFHIFVNKGFNCWGKKTKIVDWWI